MPSTSFAFCCTRYCWNQNLCIIPFHVPTSLSLPTTPAISLVYNSSRNPKIIFLLDNDKLCRRSAVLLPSNNTGALPRSSMPRIVHPFRPPPPLMVVLAVVSRKGYWVVVVDHDQTLPPSNKRHRRFLDISMERC